MTNYAIRTAFASEAAYSELRPTLRGSQVELRDYLNDYDENMTCFYLFKEPQEYDCKNISKL